METESHRNRLEDCVSSCLALDVFAKSEYAKVKKPKDRLNAWPSFFCTENTEDAIKLCKINPWLSEAYKEMAGFAANPEELIGMFSEMLHELDRNTTRYMVDDMREKIEKQSETITEQQGTITEQQKIVAEQKAATSLRSL